MRSAECLPGGRHELQSEPLPAADGRVLRSGRSLHRDHSGRGAPLRARGRAPAPNCTPNNCPQPSGACCAPDGTCTFVHQAQCTGQWLGFGTVCTPNPCPQPSGACCAPDGTCTFVSTAQCTGQWLGFGSVCSPNPCTQPSGACCAPDGTCTFVTQAQCTGQWLGFGTVCTPNPCLQLGPNSGGVLIPHDAGLLLSATNGAASVCDQGTVPSVCSGIDAENRRGDRGGSSRLQGLRNSSWPGSSPRLMGLTWGVHYSNNIALTQGGMCGDFELNEPNWPASDTGSSVTYDTPQTGLITPVYWFAAYLYGSPDVFELRDHPSQGGWFGDDSVPAILDPIAGYGALGFDVDGSAPCPDECLPGQSVVLPTTWDLGWLLDDPGTVRWYLGGAGGFDVHDVDPASLRLNGTVPPTPNGVAILPSMEGFTGPVLVARFPRGEAVHSWPDSVSGEQRTAVLDGRFQSSDLVCLRARATVTITGVDGLTGLTGHPTVASDFVLQPVQPNPSSSSIQIHFALSEPGRVSLAIFDACGRLVWKLAEEGYPAGSHTVTWDCRDIGRRTLTYGVYFLRAWYGGNVWQERLVIIR